jgi:hypothetical protein
MSRVIGNLAQTRRVASGASVCVTDIDRAHLPLFAHSSQLDATLSKSASS